MYFNDTATPAVHNKNNNKILLYNIIIRSLLVTRESFVKHVLHIVYDVCRAYTYIMIYVVRDVRKARRTMDGTCETV